jgi:hypothetical protein
MRTYDLRWKEKIIVQKKIGSTQKVRGKSEDGSDIMSDYPTCRLIRRNVRPRNWLLSVCIDAMHTMITDTLVN